jgi:hypothetical protein
MIYTLAPAVQSQVISFVNYARVQLLLPVVITSARRTTTQQASLVAQGLSRTLSSKHVSGLAFDVDMYGWNRNDVPEWVWSELGPIGEAFRMTWGGRWTSFRDVGHFEF